VIALPVVTVSRILLIVVVKPYLPSARPARNMTESVVFTFGVVAAGSAIVTVCVVTLVSPRVSGSV
jgi:hypothetical protein